MELYQHLPHTQTVVRIKWFHVWKPLGKGPGRVYAMCDLLVPSLGNPTFSITSTLKSSCQYLFLHSMLTKTAQVLTLVRCRNENNPRKSWSCDPERFAEIMRGQFVGKIYLVWNTPLETFRGPSVNALKSAGDRRLELGSDQCHTCRLKLICRG